MPKLNNYEILRKSLNNLMYELGTGGVLINGKQSAFVSATFIAEVVFDAGLLFAEIEDDFNGKTLTWDFKSFRNYKGSFKLHGDFIISDIGNYRIDEVDLQDYGVSPKGVSRLVNMFEDSAKIEISHNDVKRLLAFLKNNKRREYVTLSLSEKSLTFTFKVGDMVISTISIPGYIYDLENPQSVHIPMSYLYPYINHLSKLKGEPLIFGIKTDEPLHIRLKNHDVHGIIAPRIPDEDFYGEY